MFYLDLNRFEGVLLPQTYPPIKNAVSTLDRLREYHQHQDFAAIAHLNQTMDIAEFVDTLNGIFVLPPDSSFLENEQALKGWLTQYKNFLENLAAYETGWLFCFYMDYLASRAFKNSFCIPLVLMDLEFGELLSKAFTLLPANEKSHAMAVSLPSEKDPQPDTLLHWAVKKNKWGMAKIILDLCTTDELKKIALGSNSDGNNPLHLAVLTDNADMVQLIGEFCSAEEWKEFVYTKNKQKFTPHDLAVCNGNPQIFSLFLEYCLPIRRKCEIMKPDSDGNHLLHFAASGGSVPMIDFLWGMLDEEEKQQALEVNNKGNTPFHIAVASGQKSAVLRVFSFFNSEEKKQRALSANKEGNRPLHIAVKNGRNTLITAIHPLFTTEQERMDMLLPNSMGNTPIHLAAENGSAELFKTVIGLYRDGEWKQQAFSKNKEGNTCFHLLAKNCMLSQIREIFKFFTSEEIAYYIKQPNAKGETPFELSASNKDPNVICFLEKLFSIHDLLKPYEGRSIFSRMSASGLQSLSMHESTRVETRILAESYLYLKLDHAKFTATWKAYFATIDAERLAFFAEIVFRDPYLRNALRRWFTYELDNEEAKHGNASAEIKLAFKVLNNPEGLSFHFSYLQGFDSKKWENPTVCIPHFNGTFKQALYYMLQKWVPKINWNSPALLKTDEFYKALKCSLDTIPLPPLLVMAHSSWTQTSPYIKANLISFLGACSDELLKIFIPFFDKEKFESVFAHWTQTHVRVRFLRCCSEHQKYWCKTLVNQWIEREIVKWMNKPPYIMYLADLNRYKNESQRFCDYLAELRAIFTENTFACDRKSWSNLEKEIERKTRQAANKYHLINISKKLGSAGQTETSLKRNYSEAFGDVAS